jgi:hypothetical protein
MKKIILLTIAWSIFIYSHAQISKPHVKVFSNFNYYISSGEDENTFKEFELKRAYLGYSHKFDAKFSAKIIFDVGDNNAGSAYTAFLKIASLTWNYNEKMSVNFGQVGTKNFKFMEKAWGKRYIYKSLQDQNKWANSADLGMTIDYSINNNLSLDIQVLNGDGYKKTQSEDGLMRGGLGLTYKTGRLSARASRDIMPRNSYSEADANQIINTIAGVYQVGGIKIGGEYNMQENSGNVLNNQKDGLSIYADYKLNNIYSIFGRYDKLTSEDKDGNLWDLEKDGELTIFGIQRKMTEGVTVSLNMQTWKDAILEGEKNTLFLNLEYKF